MANSTAFASNLLTWRNNIKMYHWTTLGYSRHIATDTLVEKMDAHVDTLVETYSARYGRPEFENVTIQIVKLTDVAATAYLHKFVNWLDNDFKNFVDPKKDTDLLNVRDSLLGDVQQALYLFDLH